MKRAAVVALVIVGLSSPRAGSSQDTTGLVIRPIASVTTYLLSNSHPFFGTDARSWGEISIATGARMSRRRFGVELVALGVQTLGTDPYGTGGPPIPGTEGSGVGSLSSMGLGVDRAAISWTIPAVDALTVTAGRQRIEIGSQFLVGDGVYDGFARGSEHGVYHNPRKSFDAVRVQWEIAGLHADAFGYLVHPTWDAGGGTDGRVVALDLSRRFPRTGSNAAIGVLRRSSRSDLDNDMGLLNLRLEQAIPVVRGLRASGELVLETGRCRNAIYCTTAGARLNERSWHAELRFEDSTRAHRPLLEAGVVEYSPDFTPLAPGSADWGQWYLGNQIDWISYASNTRVFRAQAGAWANERLRVRVQYHSTSQVRPTGTSSGGPLSNEASLITEWYPGSQLWTNLVFGYARSGRALEASGLQNPFATLNSSAAVVGRRSSFDVILATGVSF